MTRLALLDDHRNMPSSVSAWFTRVGPVADELVTAHTLRVGLTEPARHGVSRLRRTYSAASSVRLCNPTLVKMCSKWVLTVERLISNRSAT